MKIAVKTLSFLAIATTALIGDPLHLSLVPSAALAARMVCSSTNYQYSYCPSNVGNANVGLVNQYSRAPCAQGRDWGYDRRGIWVNNGCAAQFQYNSGSSGGDVVGAAIVGGLIGALIGSSSSSHYSSHTTYSYHDNTDAYGRPYPVQVEHYSRPRDTSQDTDRTVQKFDKNGNPNYDADGNYQGPHGVGALVDSPEPDTSDTGSNPDGSGGPG